MKTGYPIPIQKRPGAHMKDWQWDEKDAEKARELQQRLPDKCFDAHAHVYHVDHLGGDEMGVLATSPRNCGWHAWHEHVARQLGGSRLQGGLLFPMPMPNTNFKEANRYVVEELKQDAGSRGLVLVSHDVKEEDAAELMSNPQIVGFKPYHFYAKQKPTFEASLDSFLPEWAWKMVDAQKGVIMLHMVRHKAMNDADNQREIREMCEKYPNARLVLAHAARGFHAPNTVKGLHALEGLENVYFDASGICEAAPIQAIMEQIGPHRLMWASDFPISDRRGKCITCGDNFAWINPERVDDHETAPEVHTWPVGLENLQALFDAADGANLNQNDIEDIFYNNAQRMLGLQEAHGTRESETYERAKKIIPGGVHVLSKRPEMHAPGRWPAYFSRARGCEIWDLDGRHYYDMSLNSVGASILGYADPDVSRAVKRRVDFGCLSTQNPADEVELAELMLSIHPWAEQVRFARTGGEMAAVAVRVARATTGKSRIGVCGYHGWQDWYLAANLGEDDSLNGHLLPGLEPTGVPTELRGTTKTFRYNDIEGFDKLLQSDGDQLAAIVMEPARSYDPDPGFLEHVRAETAKRGILLIFDEITIGWRIRHGGLHLKFGITPDMALFGKTMGNGHPMAALIGTGTAMDGAHVSFISSSYWTEAIGPAAALATLKKMEQLEVPRELDRLGRIFQARWREAAASRDIEIKVHGYSAVPLLTFEGERSHLLKTLFVQNMLEHGFLAGPMVYLSMAHNEKIFDKYFQAIHEVLPILEKAANIDKPETLLKGPLAQSGFGRLI